jgi:coatomer protein complex subunit gamma
MFPLNKEVVRRWANEVQEVFNNRNSIAQYHAVGLLYQIRQHDRMAVIKMIQTFSKVMRSPFTMCMLVRYTAKIVSEEPQSQLGLEFYSRFVRKPHFWYRKGPESGSGGPKW